MEQPQPDHTAPELSELLAPSERLAVAAQAVEGLIAVTDRRIVVKMKRRVALDAEFKALRRIQFDIERRRPATLVIVPEDPTDEAQVLSIPPTEIPRVTEALVIVSRGFAGLN
jgi:hypothetical protein